MRETNTYKLTKQEVLRASLIMNLLDNIYRITYKNSKGIEIIEEYCFETLTWAIQKDGVMAQDKDFSKMLNSQMALSFYMADTMRELHERKIEYTRYIFNNGNVYNAKQWDVKCDFETK